jgi:hypothetical protein
MGLNRRISMFGKDSFHSRVFVLEKEVQELKNTVNTLKGLQKQDMYLQTDPISYTDPLGNKGGYRRVGNRIEYTAEYPPKGINIKTETLTRCNGVSYAEVIGWEKNTVIMK